MSAEEYIIVCLIQGEPTPFSIEIAKDKIIDQLKKAIKKENANDLANIDAAKLTLYQIDIADDENFERNLSNRIHAEPPLELLKPTFELSEYYKAAPAKKTVHILVQVPGTKKHIPFDMEDWDAKRAEQLRKIPSIPPSSVSIDDATKRQLIYNRPKAKRETIPITLLHPVFAKFSDDCQQCEPGDKDWKWLQNLRKAMLKKYPTESARCATFRSLFTEATEVQLLTGSTVGTSKYQTDGHFVAGEYVLIISEGKNEWAGSKSDPQLQAFEYYVDAVRETAKQSERFKGSPLPCLIIYYTGALIGFAGAVSTGDLGNPQFEALTPLFDFATNEHRVPALEPVARALSATRNALTSLKTYYEELRQSSPSRSLSNGRFPSCNSYTDESGARVSFDYQRRLDDTKLVFLVSTRDDKQILVKFTQKYSREAHAHCASQGIAPKLYAVEEVGDKWMMVVMEYLDENIYTILRTFVNPNNGLPLLKSHVLKAVSTLHDAGFVHGDIRNVNVMVKKTWAETPNSDEARNVMLLDFDWAGPEDKVRYPPNISHHRIHRPKEAIRGSYITKEHDREMVEYLDLSDPTE